MIGSGEAGAGAGVTRRSTLSRIDDLGAALLFVVRALRAAASAPLRQGKETLRVTSEVGLGTGVLAMFGGSLAILGFITLFAGATVAVQGYNSLGDIGVEALTGFLAAYVNIRVVAPVTAGVGLAATIGAGTTAQLGAMRISEEIDALEVMAVDPVRYLVGTRIVAGLLTVVPLYSLSVLASFLASRVATVVVLGQSPGVYDHYFQTFLNPVDVVWSFAQAVAMALTVMIIHTYYGFTATGGPAGVGVATGRAVRMSLTAVVLVTLLISLALYGDAPTVRLAG